jgi:dimethylargininase
VIEAHERPLPPFALVRRPAVSLADGCVSFIERQPVDVELAGRQWLAYLNVPAVPRPGP